MTFLQGLNTRWTLYQPSLSFYLSPDIPFPVQKALHRRGVHSLSELEMYLTPQESCLPEIEALPDVEVALSLLHTALCQQAPIFVMGDYDVDGMTAAALFGSFLAKAGHSAYHLYLPDRFTEGYGVSSYAVDKAIREGYQLFIAVDCGTKDREQVARLKAAGLKVIILDHHAMHEGEEIPPADAFINPHRPDSSYPNRYLSAGALTYRFLRAYQQRYGVPSQWEGVDLAAISLLADIMPLVGENRALVQLGMTQLQREMRPGMAALLQAAQLSPQVFQRSRSIVYQVIPRLNVSGRLHHPKYALYLLLAQKENKKLVQVASYLNQLNAYRQSLQQKAYQQAIAQLISEYPALYTTPPPALVVFGRGWNKGVIGLVASKLVEHFHRPAIVLKEENGILTGSARSPQEVPLYQVLKEFCAPFLLRFGGHEKAAGLSLLPEKFSAFRQAFLEGCAQYKPLTRTDIIDSSLSVEEIKDSSLALWCEKFEPIGPQNEAPRFLIHGLRFCTEENGRLYFANGTDAFYEGRIEDSGSISLKEFLKAKRGTPLSIVATPRLSPGGRTMLRLRDVILTEPS
ncbi:MAG: DHH family phosphoesterase [Bacteroidia bacterium]|nr:DHHA1 domain-containing protein [Bacteroidia bacterium]MDW8014834.1 DHH family phosphoesterase [Bacteroidia bacterium]